MTPIEARYTLNGEEKKKVVAKEDGVTVVLNTPAGRARARLSPRRRGVLDTPLDERFATEFPGEPPFKRAGDALEFVFARRRYRKKANMPTFTRAQDFQTDEGRVVIELKAINSDPPTKQRDG